MDTYLPLNPLLLSDFGPSESLEETPSLPLSFDYSEWIHPGPSNPTPPPFESSAPQGWNGSQVMDGSWARGLPLPFPPFENAPGPLSTSYDAGSSSSSTSRLPSFGSLIPFDNTLPSSIFPPSPFPSLSAESDPSPLPSRPIAPKPSRSLASTAGPSPSLSTAPPRTPQADESVPEAALHLLRLALPSGSTTTGSVATNTTFSASCDEDAEGESDATSFDSDGERGAKHVAAWNYGGGSALIPMGVGRRTSGSSVGSRRRQHRPAREMSVSTRAGSEDGSVVAGGRRTSARVRKTVIPDAVRMEYASEELQDDSIREEEDDDATSPRKRATKSKSKPPAPRLQKRPLDSTSRAPPSKKPRPPPDRRTRRTAPPITSPSRTFPTSLEIHPSFPRLYRAFPLSSAFPPDSYVHRHIPLSAAALASTSAPPNAEAEIPFLEPPRGEGAQWNKSCDPFNLYAARFVKGKLEEKAGACPICMESVERGGEGVVKWLKMKNSSYVYHMSYAHGLSNSTGLPFSPPLKTRVVDLEPTTKDARDKMTEGLCHKCENWIPLLSIKNVQAVVPELIWWKHAKPCHGNSTIEGEGEYYVKDKLYELVVSRKAESAQ